MTSINLLKRRGRDDDCQKKKKTNAARLATKVIFNEQAISSIDPVSLDTEYHAQKLLLLASWSEDEIVVEL